MTTNPAVIQVPKAAAETKKPDTLSDRIYEGLINPKIPQDKKLPDRYWALAGEPATHLEFTLLPDRATLHGVLEEARDIYMTGCLEGFEDVADIQQLRIVNKLMLMKSVAYTDTPNLMDRLLTGLPSFRLTETERKPDTSFYGPIWDGLMKISRR